MVNHVEMIKSILMDFQEQLTLKKYIWRHSEAHIWNREEAYCWIYASSHYAFAPRDRSLPSIASGNELARPYYDKWLTLERDVQSIHTYIIPQPTPTDTLQSYLEERSNEIHQNEGCKTIRWRSLRSFATYLRDTFPEETGFIEVLFPKKMKIFDGKVIRKVNNTIYPVDIIVAAKILQRLFHMVLEGKPDSQLGAAETLGLAWICLTSAIKRIPTELQLLHKVPISNITISKMSKDNNVLFAIPTLYGPIQTTISKELANYFIALSKIAPTSNEMIIHSPLRCLHRTFQRAVDQVPEANGLGKITFLTLMSHPHEALGHRYQAKT